VKKRALFLKTKNIGDSIILTSAISAMPNDYEVDVLCFRDSEAIFNMHPKVGLVYVVPRHLKGVAKWLAYWRTFRQMKERSYDLIAQFSHDWRGSYLVRLLKPRVSVAKASLKRPKFWSAPFNFLAKVPVKTPRHACEQDVDLLRCLNLYDEPVAPSYCLIPDSQSENFVNAWWQANALNFKKVVLMHASARWKFKSWKFSAWVELIHLLQKDGYSVVLSGGPGDYDFNSEIVNASNTGLILVDQFTLPMTAALLKKVDLLISIDSMIVHMASATGTPVVALYGPTNERHWGPWKVSHITLPRISTIEPSFSCRPCGLDGCAGTKVSQCLYAITPAEVLAAAMQLLD
jgi:heptosyltransferase-3